MVVVVIRIADPGLVSAHALGISEIQPRAAVQPLGDEDVQMRGKRAVTRSAEAIDRV